MLKQQINRNFVANKLYSSWQLSLLFLSLHRAGLLWFKPVFNSWFLLLAVLNLTQYYRRFALHFDLLSFAWEIKVVIVLSCQPFIITQLDSFPLVPGHLKSFEL